MARVWYSKTNDLKFINKSWSPSLIFLEERFDWFLTLKKDFKIQSFVIFEGVDLPKPF